MMRTLKMMIVEKSPQAQKTFKKFFARFGFRILVSASPSRALAAASDPANQIDVVVISALELGDEAVVAFNSLSAPDCNSRVPAVLIANGKNRMLLESVQCDDVRKVIETPIRIPAIASTLSMILGSDIAMACDTGSAHKIAAPADTTKDQTLSLPPISRTVETVDDLDDLPMPD